jgi:integrase
MKNYLLTPEDFLSRKERQLLMKTCKERAELDLMKGRQTWPTRYMLIDLALYSGLRVAEIASLKVGDLFLIDDPYLIVRHGKGNKERVVYIDNQLSDHISDYLKYKSSTLSLPINTNDPLFSGRDGHHSPPITLMKSFKIAIQKTGLRSTLSIHKCRHTYATFLLQSTGNLRYVQKQLGHTDISMTSLYASILPEDNGRLANTIVRDENQMTDKTNLACSSLQRPKLTTLNW